MKRLPLLTTACCLLLSVTLHAQCDLAINLINAVITCVEETTDPDPVNLSIPFTGTDPNFTTTVTPISPPGLPMPEVDGDDPGVDNEGFIVINNMMEGGTYLISLMGQNCNFGTINYFIPDGTCGMVLPVELAFFSAHPKAENQSIKLSWATSAELNAASFHLERSTDGGRSFSPIVQIPAAGYSTSRQNYSWTDRSPAVGTNYYRLLQYDFDGGFTIYGPLRIDMEADQKEEFIIYPNPVDDQLSINAQDREIVGLEIWSLQGQQLRSISYSGVSNASISTEGIPSGMYQILVFDDRTSLPETRIITIR
ncbi:MAG: T9SS type A sorting domain-containing protein [Bacteroidota bacterium]